MRHVDAALLDQSAVGNECTNCLDRIQRNAVRTGDNGRNSGFRQSRHETGQQFAHVLFGQRLEIQRDEVPLAGAPVGTALDEVRPGERHDVDRQPAAAVEQVVDEVEQAGVGEVHVLEDQDDGTLFGDAFEEGPPGPEKLIGAHAALDSEQRQQRALDPLALRFVGDPLGDRFVDLGARGGFVVSLTQVRRARGPSRPAPRT